MATHLRSDTSADAATDIVDSIAAALEADPETADLAPSWNALVTRGDALGATLRAKRRAARRARSLVAVRDALWDLSVRAFDRAALVFYQGQKLSPSYTRFWRAGKPSEVTAFGIDREVEVGRAMIGELTHGPAVRDTLADEWRPKLTTVTDGLAAASTTRREAVRDLGPSLSEQYLFVEDINLEIDRLEGTLQTRFPGQARRVASYLIATRRDDAGIPVVTPPDPATPAAPDAH